MASVESSAAAAVEAPQTPETLQESSLVPISVAPNIEEIPEETSEEKITPTRNCKAEEYKDVNCPDTKREQLNLLRNIHPDKPINSDCLDLATKITSKITQCQYDDNGELDTDAIYAELQQNAAEATRAEEASKVAEANIYGTNNQATISDTYLGWYTENPDGTHPSESVEEQALKKTMTAFRELIEEPLKVSYPFPDLPNEIPDIPYGETNPHEGKESEIDANVKAYFSAKRVKESQVRALAEEVRKAHDALSEKNPELAGRERSVSSLGRRKRWVRKTPTGQKQLFNINWSKGTLKRPNNNTPVNASGVQPGTGPWFSGGKNKAKKNNAKKTKKNKVKKNKKGKKTKVKWYGKKNVWVKFGKNKECNHKLRRCRTVRRTMVSKSKSKTRKSTTKKSTTKSASKQKTTKRSKSKSASKQKKTTKIFGK